MTLLKRNHMGWFLLLSAGGLEVVWLITLKISDGLTRFWPSIIAIGAVNASFILLGFSLKTVSASTAYAAWTGIGAVGVVIAGILFFNEPVSALRIVSIAAVITGIAGLKQTDT